MELDLYITYVLLNILLIGTYAIAGQAVSRGRSFWQWAALCICMFTFVQGCRYGRGNDYIHYTEVFCGLSKQSDAAFIWLNSLLAFVGFNKYTCFIFYAFVFSTCGMIFLQNYRETAKWSFPLFIVTYIFFNEYQIRQAFSYSFFFLFMHYLFHIRDSLSSTPFSSFKNVALCAAFGVACCMFHSANSILVAVLLGFYFFLSRPINWGITIPIYLLCSYVIPNVFDFTILKGILFLFSDIDTMSGYVEHADFWFSKDGADDIYTRNTYIQIIEIFGVSALLYLGYKYIKDNSTKHFPGEGEMFNSFFVGVCVLSAFRELELLNRIGYDLALVSCFVLSAILHSRNTYYVEQYPEDINPEEDNVEESCTYDESQDTYIEEMPKHTPHLIFYLFLLWFVYDYLKYLFLASKMTRFLWDAPFNVNVTL